MVACPVCGAEAAATEPACPRCRLDTGLFAPVREAMALGRDPDPAFARTVVDLIRSVDLQGPAPPVATAEAATSAAESVLLLRGVSAPEPPSLRTSPVPRIPEMPTLPVAPLGDALRSRAHEYRLLASHAGVDLAGVHARADAAEAADDDRALEAAVREMFVHLASALVEAYDAETARRNEIAARAIVPGVDRALATVRSSVHDGDLTGAFRALELARTEIGRSEEAWATRRILLTECELLAATVRELGGDPSPALSPLEEGRRALRGSDADRGEVVLAQTAFALWVVLEPRFTERVRAYRDRLVELRAAGVDVGPPLERLRSVAATLQRRNFVGMIVAYRQLRDLLSPAGTIELTTGPTAVRDTPPA